MPKWLPCAWPVGFRPSRRFCDLAPRHNRGGCCRSLRSRRVHARVPMRAIHGRVGASHCHMATGHQVPKSHARVRGCGRGAARLDRLRNALDETGRCHMATCSQVVRLAARGAWRAALAQGGMAGGGGWCGRAGGLALAGWRQDRRGRAAGWPGWCPGGAGWLGWRPGRRAVRWRAGAQVGGLACWRASKTPPGLRRAGLGRRGRVAAG